MAARVEVSSTSTENEETNISECVGTFDAAMTQLKQTFQDCGYILKCLLLYSSYIPTAHS